MKGRATVALFVVPRCYPFLVLLLLLAPSGVSAQAARPVSTPKRPWHLSWHLTLAADHAVLRRYRPAATAPDSLAALTAVRDLVQALRADAYLTASADSIRFYRAGDSVRVALYLGPRLRWATVRAAEGLLLSGESPLLPRAGFREKLLRGQQLRPAELARLQQHILREAEDHGYPFARVQLDSLAWPAPDRVSGVLRLERGPLILLDSVLVAGQARISRGFLSRYLQLFPGQPYSQQRLAAAERLLRQLPYVQQTGPPRVRFARNRARLTFFLEDRRANQLDGIVGIIPVANPLPGQKRTQITGEVNLAIRNIRGGGKSFTLNWRRADAQSTALDASYQHPGLLGSPLELVGTFNLVRQASSFVTTRPRVEFAYPARLGRVSFFAEFRSSRLLADSTFRLLTTLPANLDSRYPNYGLSYALTALDDPFFPRRGWVANLRGSVGNRTITRNADVPESLYSTLKLRTTQLTGALRVERHQRLGRAATLVGRLRAEGLYNSDRLFENDLFRLGGLQSLRGFTEWQFFVSSYAVATAEYRVFTGGDSYVFLFADQGYYRRDRVQSASAARPRDWPGGAGFGLSFSTGAGVFQFVYAVGRAAAQPASLTRGRIHFGITGRF